VGKSHGCESKRGDRASHTRNDLNTVHDDRAEIRAGEVHACSLLCHPQQPEGIVNTTTTIHVFSTKCMINIWLLVDLSPMS
jgi:hypothetical protein